VLEYSKIKPAGYSKRIQTKTKVHRQIYIKIRDKKRERRKKKR